VSDRHCRNIGVSS